LNTLYRPLLKILLAVLFVLATAPNLHAEKRIGVIMTGDIPYYGAIHEIFISELEKRFAGDEKIEIVLQRPFPDPISWSNAARKLIAFDVDLIVTYGAPVTHAVIHEKSRIPLVYAGFYEPEEVVLDSKYVTGCGFKVPLSSLLRYFKRLKTVNTLGIIFSSLEEDSVRQYETMARFAEQQDIIVKKINILSQADLDRLRTLKSDAVFITGSSLAHLWLEDIVAILEKDQVPVADIFPDINEAGVLMALYQPSHAQGEIAAEMAWQVLSGTKPADLATHTFRDTELVFNLIEAKRLGINFPIQLLIEATRVIE
jgi:putative ABC transport system substrate-binding protein